MRISARRFPENSHRALEDADLGRSLRRLGHGFADKRRAAADRLPEFERLRDAARDIRDHALRNLDNYLIRFEDRVKAAGGHVHWCRDAAEARETVRDLCAARNARRIVKSKSMVAEEIGLNAYLEDHGLAPLETDLGEYIIQLRREPPSHLIMPAAHLGKDRIARAFRGHHADRPPDRDLGSPRALLDEARERLRAAFLEAEVGITGANFLIAETGTVVLVTNEGNADLGHVLPPVHIVVTSIDKVVPTLEDADVLLRVLARSATGQDLTTYTSFLTGPKRPGDPDGPREFHVVLLDNGRAAMLGGPFQEALRCIRCGACLNHCPVYRAVGGHAYGSPYSGPIGAVLTPALFGYENAAALPEASTLCGRCEEVCPVRVPLPALLRRWREVGVDRARADGLDVPMLGRWARLVRKPQAYRRAVRWILWPLALAGRRFGALGRVPGVPLTAGRDLPLPTESRSFLDQWARRREKAEAGK